MDDKSDELLLSKAISERFLSLFHLVFHYRFLFKSILILIMNFLWSIFFPLSSSSSFSLFHHVFLEKIHLRNLRISFHKANETRHLAIAILTHTHTHTQTNASDQTNTRSYMNLKSIASEHLPLMMMMIRLYDDEFFFFFFLIPFFTVENLYDKKFFSYFSSSFSNSVHRFKPGFEFWV